MLGSHRIAVEKFVTYAQSLSGDEKGEAQVFLDRLFLGFGHGGYKEAGATLESRVRAKEKGTRFADLICVGALDVHAPELAQGGGNFLMESEALYHA